MPPARAEPWNAWNMWARAFSGTPGAGIGYFDHHDAAFTPSGDANLIARRIARTARLQRLYCITRDIDQNAKQLIVIGFHCQAAFDGDDPSDRHVKTEAKRLVHFLDQRLDLNRLAFGRRLLRAAIRKSCLAERDCPLERAHQLGRKALHFRIRRGRELVGKKLRRSKQIAQVVIDLRHRKAERRQPALLMQHRGEFALHGAEFFFGGADFIADGRSSAMMRDGFSGSARNATMLSVMRHIGRTKR